MCVIFVHATKDRDRQKKIARDILINDRRKTNVWWETATKMMIYFCLKLSVWQPLWCLQIHICLRCSGCFAVQRLFNCGMCWVSSFYYDVFVQNRSICVFVRITFGFNIFSFAINFFSLFFAHSLANTNTKNNFRYKWFQLDVWTKKQIEPLLMFDGKTLENAFNQCTTALMTLWFDLILCHTVNGFLFVCSFACTFSK